MAPCTGITRKGEGAWKRSLMTKGDNQKARCLKPLESKKNVLKESGKRDTDLAEYVGWSKKTSYFAFQRPFNTRWEGLPIGEAEVRVFGRGIPERGGNQKTAPKAGAHCRQNWKAPT